MADEDRPLFDGHEPIILITGIQAAGKSTVAGLLARRFSRGVHVEGDALQHMIVSGREGVQAPGMPTGEAERQYLLRLKHMCLLGRSFFESGFAVVLDDIVLGESWPYVRQCLRGVPFELVVLAPRLEVVSQQRDLGRSKRPLGAEWAIYLDGVLRATMTGIGYWLDTSDQTPDETVEHLYDWLQSGRRTG
jgi:predicted kinase